MPLPEVLELNQIRLDRDLSYRALGEEIGLPERTVYRILNNPRQRVWDRTLHKIRGYLERERGRTARGSSSSPKVAR